MAISFVGAGAVGTGSNPTAAVPAGIQKDDLLLIVTSGSATPTTPAGWTPVSSQGAGQFLTVFFKFATASETNVTLTQTGTSSRAVMLAYRGAGGIELRPAFATGTGTTVTPNNVTTTYSNDYVIRLYACAIVATTWTANASTTSRVNSSPTAALTGLLIADELQAAAGTSATRAATLAASRAWSAISIAIIEDNRPLYWVGGNGNWTASGATNWSNTSGGAGGVVPPTLMDNAIVDASSGSPTITTTLGAQAKSLTTTGATCVFTGTAAPTINGDVTLSATTTWPATGTLLLVGTGTITTNGVSISSLINFNGVSQTFTLGGNLTSTNTLILTAGSLNTNDTTINANLFSSSNTNIRTLNLGSSTINLTATGAGVWNATTSTNLTLNAGTSQINLTGLAPTFSGGGRTYHNLNFANGADLTITQNNTFNTLSCSAQTVPGSSLVLTGTTQTVTNFNVNGGSVTNSITIAGGTLSKSSGTVSTSFAAISTAATGGATWNAFGCQQLSAAATGWNFGVQTRYLVGAGALNNFTTPGRWSTTSGGPANVMAPFEFDDVIFDANSGAVAFNFTANDNFIKSLNTTGFTGSYAGDSTTTIHLYGSFIIGASTTLGSIASSHELALRGTSSGNVLTIGSSSKNFTGTITTNCVLGSYTLTTNITASIFNFISGTFNFGNNTVTVFREFYDTNATGSITINLNSSTINLSGAVNPFDYISLYDVNTTVNPGTSVINLNSFSSTGHSFNSNKTFNIINLNNIQSGDTVRFLPFFSLGSGPTINKLTTNNTVGGYSLLFPRNAITAIGEFDIRGTVGNRVTVSSSDTTDLATLASLNGAIQDNINHISFIRIIATPTPTATGTVPYYWYVGANSIKDSASTGLVFSSDTSYIYYNLTSGTSWSVPANWNNSSNDVYLIGGGGGGSGSVVASSTGTHTSGSGGAGGGFTALTNVSLTPGGTAAYAIGAAGSAGVGSTTASNGGNGGTTTFIVSNTAGGGGRGSATTTTSTAGTAGIGSTFNGGAGGSGTAAGNVSNAGAGGGGGAGLNGSGLAGGNNTGTTIGTGGQPNNNSLNFLFVSGAYYGAGGNGGSITTAGLPGGDGIFGGRGGGGGGGGTSASSATTRAGGLGTQGVIVLRYRLAALPSSGNFLTFFYQ